MPMSIFKEYLGKLNWHVPEALQWKDIYIPTLTVSIRPERPQCRYYNAR